MQANAIQSNALLDKYGYTPGMTPGSTPEENLFLTILTTQLRNQDPLQPLENGEFVDQISGMASIQETQTLNAQLSSMIQLQQILAGQNAFTQSAALVGKNVTYVDPETKEQAKGYVSQIKLIDGALLLEVNGKDVPMSSVIGITADDAASDDTAADDTAADDSENTPN
jgi:flagellar basal-body rod modification protein FlgD